MNESAVVFISMRLVEHVDNPIFHAYNEPSEELENSIIWCKGEVSNGSKSDSGNIRKTAEIL